MIPDFRSAPPGIARSPRNTAADRPSLPLDLFAGFHMRGRVRLPGGTPPRRWLDIVQPGWGILQRVPRRRCPVEIHTPPQHAESPAHLKPATRRSPSDTYPAPADSLRRLRRIAPFLSNPRHRSAAASLRGTGIGPRSI